MSDGAMKKLLLWMVAISVGITGMYFWGLNIWHSPSGAATFVALVLIAVLLLASCFIVIARATSKSAASVWAIISCSLVSMIFLENFWPLVGMGVIFGVWLVLIWIKEGKIKTTEVM